MSNLKSSKHYQALKKGFENNRVFCHVHCYEVYRNWLEAVWLFCNAAYEPDQFKQRLDTYTVEQGREFSRLMNLYVEAAERHPFKDILGELFMELDVQSARSGQYFTPGEIAVFMARMQFSKENFERTVQEKGEFTVCDPAVGSGVMLLAFAEVVSESLGRGALKHVKFYGSDIDQRCVHMCRIQLRLNCLDEFGRMAGLIGSICGSVESARALPTGTPPTIDVVMDDRPASAQPDLSHAVILHNGEEEHDAVAAQAEQLVLF